MEEGRSWTAIAHAIKGASANLVARLIATEQTVFIGVVTNYANVLRDQAVVELRANNEQRLRRQLEATRDRFRVGEVTRTDVAQAESRLSRSSARRAFPGTVLAKNGAAILLCRRPPSLD